MSKYASMDELTNENPRRIYFLRKINASDNEILEIFNPYYQYRQREHDHYDMMSLVCKMCSVERKIDEKIDKLYIKYLNTQEIRTFNECDQLILMLQSSDVDTFKLAYEIFFFKTNLIKSLNIRIKNIFLSRIICKGSSVNLRNYFTMSAHIPTTYLSLFLTKRNYNNYESKFSLKETPKNLLRYPYIENKSLLQKIKDWWK